MYKLNIGAYKDFEPSFHYINSDYTPRKGEIIKRYPVYIENDDESVIEEYWTLEVQAVHYELFDDMSSIPIIFATVVSSCLQEEYESE